MHALVMELVEGATLAERDRVQVPFLSKTLSHRAGITEALEYAHDRKSFTAT